MGIQICTINESHKNMTKRINQLDTFDWFIQLIFVQSSVQKGFFKLQIKMSSAENSHTMISHMLIAVWTNQSDVIIIQSNTAYALHYIILLGQVSEWSNGWSWIGKLAQLFSGNANISPSTRFCAYSGNTHQPFNLTLHNRISWIHTHQLGRTELLEFYFFHRITMIKKSNFSYHSWWESWFSSQKVRLFGFGIGDAAYHS